MKPKITSLLLVWLLSGGFLGSSLVAQSVFDSEHLADPDLLIDYVDTNASFWLSVFDAANGGFYTNVSRDGSVITAWGTNKDVLTQSRDAYAMVRAFQLTGDESYLDLARSALDFMYAHGWDESVGGWFNKLSSTGGAMEPNAAKTAFVAHYALLGPMAFVEATDSAGDWDWLTQGYEYNESALWDTRPNALGYYDRTNRAGTTPSGKSFNATVDAITTHALQLYLLTGDNKYLERLEELADNILDRLVASMSNQSIGFAEKFNSDWQVDPGETLTIMGHVLKTAWCLSRIYQVIPDPAYLAAARDLADHVLQNGYDHDFGGPYKDYNRTTGEMQLWGLQDTTKAWWQMEQAVVAGLELYRATDDERYLEMADETLDFFIRFFQDPVYGEVYADRTRNGGGIAQWGDHKGDGYKAAYHSVELGYYTFLYAKLFLHGDIATLHYRFDTDIEDRAITLSPLSAAPSDITIAAVRKDGVEYTDFVAAQRTLNLAAGTSGHFEVDFIGSGSVSTDAPARTDFELAQNYPNPAASTSVINYSLSRPEHIQIDLYDVVGRKVQNIVTGIRSAGPGKAIVDVSDLPSGVYVYRIVTPKGSKSRRMTVRH